MEDNFRVPVTIIKNIEPIHTAERLEIATVFDFRVVVRKGQYQIGSSVLYVPIDSILPPELEAKIFGENSKIKLNKGRVRQIRIRGAVSQGMLINPADTGLVELEEGQDVSADLGITKYEPEVPHFQDNQPSSKKERNRSWENVYFHEYGGLLNAKWYPDLFVEGQDIVYTCKIHGTNGRAALLPYKPKSLWQRFIKFIGIAPDYQFAYGSNKVQLQSKSYTGFYDENIYSNACNKYDIKNKLNPHETVYFEIYGDGIQKNYTYGCKQGEQRIVVFDVKVLADDCKSTRWLNITELEAWCKKRDLPMVPILYRGPHSSELAKQYTLGPSVLSASQKVREGIVIKDPVETNSYIGKKYLKLISEDYLDADNSDFH